MKFSLWSILLLIVLASCGSMKKTGKDGIEYDPLYINTFHDAVRLKIRGELDESLRAFEECLLMRDDDDAVHYALSELYLLKNDRQRSADHIKKAAVIDAGNIWYTQELAYMYYEAGLYTEAITQFEKLIREQPRNIEWLYGYAESLVKAGKTGEAIKAYDSMEQQLGIYPELAIQKYKLYLQLKQEEKALNEILEARKVFPMDPQLIATLVDHYFQRGKEAEAVKMLEELVLTDPNNGRAHLALADIYRQRGEQRKAYAELKKAFACTDVTLDNKMQILITIHDNNYKIDPEVFELVELIVQLHPTDAKSHSIRGDYMLKAGNNEEAIKSYKRALEFDKNLFPIWNQVLVMEYQANRFNDLYNDSKACLEYFTTMPTVYLLNGVACNQLKKYEEAVTILSSGIELVVSDKAVEAEFNAQLGEAWFGNKDPQNGKSFYEKAVKLDPQSTLIKNNYAYRLAIWKTDLERAEALIDEVLRTSGETPHYLDTKGYVLFMKGDFKEALIYINMAHTLKPEDPITTEHLGDVHFKLGDKIKAIEFWKKAKEMGATNKTLEKKIEKKEYYDPIY
jgi:tetratricopeptide (TPR) repeat protein